MYYIKKDVLYTKRKQKKKKRRDKAEREKEALLFLFIFLNLGGFIYNVNSGYFKNKNCNL